MTPKPSDDVRDVRALVAEPKNRRVHTERNVELLRDSLKSVGAARSIVIDEDDVVLAGNGVTAAALAAGITNVRVIESTGDELIAVRRRGLTDEQKRALALFDNRTAELATWDVAQLASDRDAGLDFRPFWTEAEEAMLLGEGVKPAWGGMPEFTQEDETAYRTIKVHFTSQADVDAFFALVGQTFTEKTRWIWYPREPEKRTLQRDKIFVGTDDVPPPADV